ncbi:MAG: GDSL-type esterase/lipase family protein [Crocosphaera sp.]|nr:GDSL-type esterase/lipase family protein [Crocosphaera sp.]
MTKEQSALTVFFILVIVFLGLVLTFGLNITGLPFLIRQISKITLISPFHDQRYQTPYYQKKVQEFRQQPGSKQDTFLVGDSLTDQGNWTKLLNQTNLKNRGISGDTTEGVLNRLDEIINVQPQKIFIMIGVNDLWNENRTVEQIIANYQEILTTLKYQTPASKVYIQSLLPINNRDYPLKINNKDVMEVNQKLQILATEFNYEYLDLYPQFIDEFNQLKTTYTNDGVHLTTEGYQAWAKAIAQWVK